MSSHLILLCILLTFSLSFNGISAAISVPKFIVINEDPKALGNIKFEKVIGGIPATMQILAMVHKVIITEVLQQKDASEQKPVLNNTIYIYIKDFIGVEGNAWGGNRINISSVYLYQYVGDIKWEFTSLLFHEVAHLLTFDGGFKPVPYGLREGLADYAILKANYYPEGFAKPGSGDKWDASYDLTARFLEYCDSVTPGGGFVPKLNRMLKTAFDISHFKVITGKPVEQLWKEYKAKYAKKDINT